MSLVSKLRKVGGSVMLSIPPAVLQTLSLNVEDAVDLSVAEGTLIVTPRKMRAYSLDDLLRACDRDAAMPIVDSEWTAGSSHGEEVL
ncbi:MAG: AbrB/MazE/SpoVT family DNA-binding domain-containing protein [Hyphomicrobiales bacterium]